MHVFLSSSSYLRAALLLWLWLLAGLLPASAVHLLGGEMTYKFLDATGPADKPWRYELTMRVYYNPVTDPAEQPLIVKVYNRYSYPALLVLGLRRTRSIPLTVPALPGCGSAAPPVAVGVYVTILNLPVSGGGFRAVCSTTDRLAGIANIKQSEEEGMGLSVEMLPGTIPNSSPVFTTPPVSLICLGTTSQVLNTAYDADGDQLEYSLSTPRNEYEFPVTYAPGYNPTQPFGATGGVTLNSVTGLATYRSMTQGIFQLAVDVAEYRLINGQRQQLSLVHRDMQVVVRACAGLPGQPPAFTAATLAQRNFQLREGQALTFNVAATDPDGDPLTLTASSALLDGPGGIDASFGSQQGGSLGGSPVGQATVRGTGTATGVFRLAGCGLDRRAPYEVVVTATDEVCNSQTVVATFLITVTRPSFVGVVQGDATVCSQSTATYSVQNTGYSAYQWEVTGGQVLGPATGPTVEVLWGPIGTGTVRVGGLTDTGCPTQLLAYPVAIRPGLAVNGPAAYCLAAATSLRYTLLGPSGAYQWTITEGTISKGQGTSEVLVDIRPGATATLRVSSQVPGSCVTTLRIGPDADCLNFYNVITPNGDAKNDLFIIQNLERYPHTTLTIFNRWGTQVYHTDDYLNTYDGAGSSPGIYYYRCQLADGTLYKGWFELIR